jgi:hypothetical protein
MTHPFTRVLSNAGVSSPTQQFGPLGSALIVSPFGSMDEGQFRTAHGACVLKWADFVADSETQGFEIETTAPGGTINVVIFMDQRHGLCVALGYPLSADRMAFNLEFWPVTNREAPFVKVWEDRG